MFVINELVQPETIKDAYSVIVKKLNRTVYIGKLRAIKKYLGVA